MNTTEIPRETSEFTPERKAKLLEFVEEELQRMSGVVLPLLKLRHDLFEVNQTEYSKDLSIEDQLYEHPSNNIDFINHDMGLRRGNALGYHQTTERYDRGISEEHAERDFTYRQAILKAAQELGFISKHPGIAADPTSRELGILDSELEPIPEKVAAVVMDPGAGKTGVKRLWDTKLNIESGVINTDRIIVSSSARVIDDAEKGRTKPYEAGNTEFETAKLTIEKLFGATFEDDESEIPMAFGEDLKAKVIKTVAQIGDHLVTIELMETPFDPEREMTDGTKAKRTNTTEVYLGTLPLLEGTNGPVVVVSHDTWKPWQNVIGHGIFGLTQGRDVYIAGPFNSDRLYLVEENGKETLDINAPQDVIDEIVKTYEQLVRLQLALQRG
jgi:hypothetical protein